MRWFSELRRSDVASVGGKNASLGEMINTLGEAGIEVPGGFATTAAAYWQFLEANDLTQPVSSKLNQLKDDGRNVAAIGKAVRKIILAADFPTALSEAITRDMARRSGHKVASVAVRSSATAEDLPEASFAGQLESFLNVRGDRALLDACKRCFASLFTDRAIVYSRNHGIDPMTVALSVGVQEMVRSDKAGAGVMFSIDTESGFPKSVLITAAWGLGEAVVQGMVDPDEYQVFKPLLCEPSVKPIIEKKLGAKARKVVYASHARTASRRVDTTERALHVRPRR